MTGHGPTSPNSLPISLKERIHQVLKPDLLAAHVRVSDYEGLPFAILHYAPNEEFELRQELQLLEAELYHKIGRIVHRIDLTELMWTAISKVIPVELLFDSERDCGVEATAETVFNILSQDDQAPLHVLVKERLEGLSPENEIAFLTRAGGLFPAYRTNALLENLKGVKVPTILCYPGTLTGTRGLRYMDEYEPDPNYRPLIY